MWSWYGGFVPLHVTHGSQTILQEDGSKHKMQVLPMIFEINRRTITCSNSSTNYVNWCRSKLRSCFCDKTIIHYSLKCKLFHRAMWWSLKWQKFCRIFTILYHLWFTGEKPSTILATCFVMTSVMNQSTKLNDSLITEPLRSFEWHQLT